MNILNHFTRLATFVRLPQMYKHTTIAAPTLLVDFLSSNKEKYLQDARGIDGKAKEWTVVMGNEAGGVQAAFPDR